jgi:hypothetical protein
VHCGSEEAEISGEWPHLDGVLVASSRSLITCQHVGWFLRRAQEEVGAIGLAVIGVTFHETAPVCDFLRRERIRGAVLLPVEPPESLGGLHQGGQLTFVTRASSGEGTGLPKRWISLEARDGLELWDLLPRD